jgi:hypothetical protein
MDWFITLFFYATMAIAVGSIVAGSWDLLRK